MLITFIKRLFHTVWVLAVLFAILVTLYVTSCRYALDQLPEYKEKIERLVGAKLNVPISIGSIEGYWDWIRPSVVISDIKINPDYDQPQWIPKLARARIQVNILASMLKLEPKLGRFDLSGLEITVERQASGHVRLVGLPKETSGKVGNESVVTTQLWQTIDKLLEQKSVFIEDYHVNYFENDQQLSLKGADLLLSKQLSFYSLSTELWFLKEQELGLTLVAQFDADKSSFADLTGRIFVGIEQGDLGPWLPEIKWGSVRLEALTTRSRIWGTIESGRLSRVRASLVAEKIDLVDDRTQEHVIIDELSGHLQWNGLKSSKLSSGHSSGLPSGGSSGSDVIAHSGTHSGTREGENSHLPPNLASDAGSSSHEEPLSDASSISDENADQDSSTQANASLPPESELEPASGKRTEIDSDSNPGWELKLANLRFTESGTEHPPIESHVRFQPKQESVEVWVNQIPLEPVGKIVNLFRSEFVPSNPNRKRGRIELGGSVEALSIRKLPETFQISTQANALSIRLVQGEPKVEHSKEQREEQGKGATLFALTGLNGFLALNEEGGGFNLDGKHIQLQLPSLYDHSLTINQLSGPLSWQKEHSHFALKSGLMTIANDDTQGELMFSYLHPLVEKAQESQKNQETQETQKKNTAAANQREARLYPVPTLQLIGTLNSGNAGATNTYLPSSLPSKLHEWLVQGNIQGDLLQGDFLYNGPLRSPKERSWEKTFQMRFLVGRGELTYHTEWPRLTDLHTQIVVNNREVWALVNKGQVLNAQLKPSHVFLPEVPFSEPTAIMVRAAASGGIEDGIAALSSSPVAKQLPPVLQSITGKGGLNFSLDLDLPLSPSKETQQLLRKKGIEPKAVEHPLTLALNAQLEEGDLLVQALDLPLKQVNGDLLYLTERGLQSQALQLELLGQPVTASITSQHQRVDRVSDKQQVQPLSQGDSEHSSLDQLQQKGPSKKRTTDLSTPPLPQWNNTVIALNGLISIEALNQWRPSPLLDYASGTAPFSAEFYFNKEPKPLVGHHFLEVHTNLSGVELYLPKPFKKEPNQKRHLFYQTSLIQEQPFVTFQFADQLGSVLSFNQDGSIDRGRFHLGSEPLKLPEKSGVIINGDLSELTFEEWIGFLKGRGSNAGQLSEESRVEPQEDSVRAAHESERSSFLNAVRWVDVNIEKLDIYGAQFKAMSGQLVQIDDHWNLAIQNRDIAAFSRIPEIILTQISQGLLGDSPERNPWMDQIAAIETDIQYIYLPFDQMEEKRGESEASQRAGGLDYSRFDPRYLPPLDIDIKRLYLDEEDWGEWQAIITPVDQGVAVDQVLGQWRNLLLDMKGEWIHQTIGAGSVPMTQPGGSEGLPEVELRSNMRGVIRANNIADVMTAWDYTPSMTSKQSSLQLDLSWLGAPWDFSIDHSRGRLDLDLRDGELLDIDSAASTVKVIGLLNIHTLQRRLQLDFRDLFNKGIAYDRIFGAFTADHGVLRTPALKVEGPSAQFEIIGSTDFTNKTIDHILKITLPVSRNLVLPAAAAGGLPLAATAYLVERALGNQLDKLTTFKMKAVGDWQDPDLSPVGQAHRDPFYDDEVDDE